MIEKLPEIQIHSCAKINEKLNEVIDVVNGILDYAPLEMAMKAEPDEPTISKMEKNETPAENVQPGYKSRPENVQDPYAEQRFIENEPFGAGRWI